MNNHSPNALLQPRVVTTINCRVSVGNVRGDPISIGAAEVGFWSLGHVLERWRRETVRAAGTRIVKYPIGRRRKPTCLQRERCGALVRVYHETARLLRDGYVPSAGGAVRVYRRDRVGCQAKLSRWCRFHTSATLFPYLQNTTMHSDSSYGTEYTS